MTTAAVRRESSCARRPAETRERCLLGRIATKDRTALLELNSSYRQRLRRFLTCLTLRADVEDMIIDILFVVWQTAPNYRDDSRICAWIGAIALHRGLLLQPPAKSRDADASGVLECGLQELPIEQRALYALTYCLGCSCEEVASIVQCPVDSVKTEMIRGRPQLQLALFSLGRRGPYPQLALDI